MLTPTPTPSEPAIQAAARLLAQGRPAAAAERLAALVAEAPTYAAAHVLRATALEAAGFIDEAIVSWGRAAALVPRSPLVHRERERLMATRLADESAELPPPEPAPEPPEAVYRAADDALPAVAELEAVPEDAYERDLDAPAGDDETLPAPSASAADERLAEAPAADSPDEVSPDPFAQTAEAEDPMDEAVPGEVVPILPPEDPEPSPAAEEDPADPFGWEIVDEEDVPLAVPDAEAYAPLDAPEAPPSSIADELDALIAQLEVAPRIRPDPEYAGPEVSLDTGEVDELASETLAKIYAAQHRYVEAAVVYEKLAAQRPDEAEEMLRRAAELRERG